MVTPLEPGDPRRLGRWRLVGRLGAGGMGVVYLGRGRRGRRVAIKVPRADLFRDPQFRERFRREAEAASAITARCTARVLEVHADRARPYIVTEYVEGLTLQEAVAANGPLQGTRLVSFATGVAEAMAAMHAAGVTHRDLTPGNVILGRWGPKVIDFGIARAEDAATLTQTGMSIGTPAWMAPEQARGDRVGPAADTFSWGTLVAYAGTGRHPFGNGRVDAVIYRVVHEPPDLVGLDGPVAVLVGRALDKDPAGRPAPADLLDALTPFESPSRRPGDRVPDPAASRSGEMAAVTVPNHATRPAPTRVQPAAPPRRPRRWGRRLALTVLVLVFGAALGGGLAFIVDRENDDEEPEEVAAPPATVVVTTTDPPATSPPTTASPRSATAYCGAATEFFDRSVEFEDQFDIFTTQDEYEAAFIEFAADNLDLLNDMADTAPDEIAGDVLVILGAYEQAAEGDLSGFDTFEFDEADDRVEDFEGDECGIDHGGF